MTASVWRMLAKNCSTADKGCFMRCFKRSRFCDYDNKAAFLELAKLLEPAGFEDVTYNNDVCPSVAFGEYDEAHIELRVFVDYADPKRRECDGDIFTVCITSDHPDVSDDFIVSTDSMETAIHHAIEAKHGLSAKLEDVFNLFRR